MTTAFPSSLDTFTNPAPGDPLHPGHPYQHSNANDAIAALEAKVGVDSSAVTSSLDYKVRVSLPASVSAAQAAAIAACPAETASTVGSLIAGASEKAIIASGDKIALSDSAASGILKWGSTADILQALYLLGMPLTAFQSAIPFFLLPGDGGTNGLTFTGGGGGAFTLSAAPMSGLLSNSSGQGCYGYLPANAGNSGCAAGWYYFIPSSDTAGTFYNDQYTGGLPALIGSPTTFAGSPSGRITQSVSEIVALSGLTLPIVGNNGVSIFGLRGLGDSSATTKAYKIRAAGSTLYSDQQSATIDFDKFVIVRNRGTMQKQTVSHHNVGAGVGGSSSIIGDFPAFNLSSAVALTVSMQLGANTGCAALFGFDLVQRYGA